MERETIFQVALVLLAIYAGCVVWRRNRSVPRRVKVKLVFLGGLTGGVWRREIKELFDRLTNGGVAVFDPTDASDEECVLALAQSELCFVYMDLRDPVNATESFLESFGLNLMHYRGYVAWVIDITGLDEDTQEVIRYMVDRFVQKPSNQYMVIFCSLEPAAMQLAGVLKKGGRRWNSS